MAQLLCAIGLPSMQLLAYYYGGYLQLLAYYRGFWTSATEGEQEQDARRSLKVEVCVGHRQGGLKGFQSKKGHQEEEGQNCSEINRQSLQRSLQQVVRSNVQVNLGMASFQ